MPLFLALPLEYSYGNVNNAQFLLSNILFIWLRLDSSWAIIYFIFLHNVTATDYFYTQFIWYIKKDNNTSNQSIA